MAVKAMTSITENTPNNLWLDAGAVWLNYDEEGERLLGATRGGNSFALNPEFRRMEFDGAKGPTKGMTRVVAIAPVITANLLELTKENLLMALAGSEVDETDPEEDVITVGDITADAYIENVALVGTISGGDEAYVGRNVIIILKNVLPQGGMEINMTDQDEAVITVEFHAHFDIDDFDSETGEWEVPFEIRFPKEAS